MNYFEDKTALKEHLMKKIVEMSSVEKLRIVFFFLYGLTGKDKNV